MPSRNKEDNAETIQQLITLILKTYLWSWKTCYIIDPIYKIMTIDDGRRLRKLHVTSDWKQNFKRTATISIFWKSNWPSINYKLDFLFSFSLHPLYYTVVLFVWKAWTQTFSPVITYWLELSCTHPALKEYLTVIPRK